MKTCSGRPPIPTFRSKGRLVQGRFRVAIGVAILLAAHAFPSWAQGLASSFVKVGDRTNLTPAREASEAFAPLRQFDIAQDADGDFAVAALVEGNLVVRRFDAAGRSAGPDIIVDSKPDDDLKLTLQNAVIAMDAGGGFVVAWSREGDGGDEIMARRYDRNGAEQSQKRSISPANCRRVRPASPPSKVEGELVVASNADGNFVLAWRQNSAPDTEAPEYRIVACMFDRHARLVSTEPAVVTSSSQQDRAIRALDVALDMDGAFVIVWHDTALNDPNGICKTGQIFARRFRFDENGIPQAPGVLNIAQLDSIQPKIAMTPAGDFLVAWDGPFEDRGGGEVQCEDEDADDDETKDSDRIVIQKYRFDGQAIWDQPLEIVDPCAEGECPGEGFDLSVDTEGGFAVVWQVGGKIRGVVSDASGQRLGSVQQLVDSLVREKPLGLRRPLISMDADGDMLLAWAENFAEDDEEDREDPRRIRAQRYRSIDPIDLKVRQDPIAASGTATTDARFGYRLKVRNIPARQVGDLEQTHLDRRISRAIGTATNVKVTASVPQGADFPAGFGEGWNCLPSTPSKSTEDACEPAPEPPVVAAELAC